MERELCTSPGVKVWKISRRGWKQKRWLGLREKVGMLMLSHYELESSDDSSLSYPSKHSVSKERFAYWTGQLWRGEKSCKCTIEPPSEQELPYDSQCFVRLYDLANLISIGDEECTEIQNDRSNRINIQPGERYLHLKFVQHCQRNDNPDVNVSEVPEQQKYQLLKLCLKTPQEMLSLAEVLRKFRDCFRLPFKHYEFSVQPQVQTPSFLLEPESVPGEAVQEDLPIPCFPHLLSHTYPRPQLLASLAAIVLQPFLPRRTVVVARFLPCYDAMPRMVAGPCGAGKSVLDEVWETNTYAYWKFFRNLQQLTTRPLMLAILKGLHSVVLTKRAVGEVVQRPFKFQTIDNALNWIREVIRQSKLCCLIVADDIWERQVVEILFQTQCYLLVTSPNRMYLSGIGAEWIDIGPMGEEDASALAGMTDPRDVWRGIGMLPLALKQSSIVASFLGGWKEFWFEFEKAKEDLLQTQQFLGNILRIQQEWCGGGSILEKEDTISLIVITSVALSAAGELINNTHKADPFKTRVGGSKRHDQGLLDIQTLYIMLAIIPFGLAVPEAVLQALWWGPSLDGIAAADRPKGIRDVMAALESFLLVQRIDEGDRKELFLVNHIQSIYIQALAEMQVPLVRMAQTRLREYLRTIPALLGLGYRSCLSDTDYIAQWPVELYGGLGRYGILDALIASVGGVSLDVLANDYQESLNKAAGPPYQQDDSNNKRSSLDSNPFSLAATLASICDVLCMPSNVAVRHSVILTSNSGSCLDADLLDNSIVPSKVPAFRGYCMALELLEKLPQFGDDSDAGSLSFYREQGKKWSSLAEVLARAGSIHYARMLYRRSIELYLAVAWKVSQQHEHFWQYSNKCGTIERDRRRVFHPMQCYKRKAFFRRKRGFGAVSPSAPERRGYSALNLEARHQSDEDSWELDVAFFCVDELGHVVSVAKALSGKGDHSSTRSILQRGLAIYQVLLGETHPLTALTREQFIHICQVTEPGSRIQKNGRSNRLQKGPSGEKGGDITMRDADEKRSLGMVTVPILGRPTQEVDPHDVVVPCHDTLAVFSAFPLAPRRSGAALSLLELARQCMSTTRSTMKEPESDEMWKNNSRRSGLLGPPGKSYEKNLAYGYLIACAAKHLEEERLLQNNENLPPLYPTSSSSKVFPKMC